MDHSLHFHEDYGLIDNLDEIDFSSVHLSDNLGSIFIFVLFTFIGLFFIVVGYGFRGIKCGEKVHDKLKAFLLWNWCIRLVLEAAMDFCFGCILNLFYGNFYDQPWGA